MTTPEVADLVASNLGLVGHIVARSFRGHLRRAAGDVVYSAGLEGLLRAAESFDQTRGVKFSTWASRCIHNAIVQALVRWKRDPCSRRGTRHLDAPVVPGEPETVGEVLEDARVTPPQETAARVELRADLGQALSGLRPDLGAVLLARLAGVSDVEQAAARQVTKQAVGHLARVAMGRLARGHGRLRRHLDG
jgi:RNA polymerase sigma factor (sigma-70 family)